MSRADGEGRRYSHVLDPPTAAPGRLRRHAVTAARDAVEVPTAAVRGWEIVNSA